MKSALVIVLATALVIAEAKVAPTSAKNDAHTTAQEPVQLSEILSQAQANINDLTNQINQHIRTHLDNPESAVNVVKEHSNNFVTALQNYVKNVSEEVKNKSPELENLWTDIKGKLTKVVEDLSSGVPEAQVQINQLGAKFQEGVQVLIKESDNAVKTLNDNSDKVQENVAKYTKQAVEIALQAVSSMNEGLQKVPTSATATAAAH
ncbi:hypothetical protein KM043_014411 [Ampulex compressa]|uniref:Apolipophorin-III-like protein n=1 Tax=Ampulex compressa TaxID=860918 RepID=A0A1W6EWA3_AMPCP|nr:apolipophorin-III-like protein [Ampulex compressa]KAG7199987.1 hypothetical protein KM043_014411 [Ampulex compressa]